MNNNYNDENISSYDTCECPDIDFRIRRFEKQIANIDASYLREYSLEGIHDMLYL